MFITFDHEASLTSILIMQAVTSTSKWEDVRPIIEDAQDFRYWHTLGCCHIHANFLETRWLNIMLDCILVGYRALSDDSSRKKVFDDYVTHLLHKAKDKERKREKEEKVSFYLEVCVFSIIYTSF